MDIYIYSNIYYIGKVLSEIIPEIATKMIPAGWALLPSNAKQTVIETAMADLPISIKAVIDDVQQNVNEVFDLKNLVRNSFLQDKKLLSNIFITCGKKELIFIRNFGAVLGIIFGCAQMIADIKFSGNYWFDHLMLPVSGFILGWCTNWIALLMIFKPINPKYIRCCCWSKPMIIQGLFLQRQKEVSVVFSNFITKKILRADIILGELMRGPQSNVLYVKIRKHLKDACDRFGKDSKMTPIIEWSLGKNKFNDAKNEVINSLLQLDKLSCFNEIQVIQKEIEKYTEEAMDIERTLRYKMAHLSPEKFEGVLHPVFQEDEIKLIVIGAILGLIVGLLQVYVIKN